MLSQSLEGILKTTFGPNGLDVMLTSSSGNILITNSGAVILKSLSVTHPVGRMIVDKVVCHCSITGDGATSFILILAEVLRKTLDSCGSRHKARDSGELDSEQRRFMITLANRFASLERRTLDDFVLPILEKLSLKINVSTEDGDLVKQKVLSLIKTTLCGNFPPGAVSLFSTLLTQLVFNTCTLACGKTIHDTILRLIDDFPQICVEVAGIPSTSSQVLPGILIPREFATNLQNLPLSPADGPFKFVVLDCSLDSDKLQVNATLELKSESALDDALIWKRTRVQRILRKLKDHNVHLILSSESLTDYILHFCRQLKICVVQMIPLEYTNYICACAEINPLSEFDVYVESIAVGFLGSGVFCKHTVLGQHRYVHLGVQTNSNGVSPHCLLLCGSAQGICQQYSIAALGALKTFRMAFSKDKDHLKLLPGGGATEAAISHELNTYSKSLTDPYEAIACRILSKGLMAIPRQLHHNSHSIEGRKMNFIHQLPVMEKAWVSGMPQGIDGRTGKTFNPFERETYEPFRGKYYLLSHLLQSVSQLLRTDQLVGVGIPQTGRDKEEDCTGEMSDSDE